MLPSPPHPEYVSGHAGFSGAAARMLAEQLGEGATEFAATSDSVPRVVRRFHSLQACAEEIARSRVYGGIHYAMSGHEGRKLGACGTYPEEVHPNRYRCAVRSESRGRTISDLATTAMENSPIQVCLLAVIVHAAMLCFAARGATIAIRNTLDDGTGAYAIASESFVPFDNTDSDQSDDGLGVLGTMTISDAAIVAFWNAGNIAAIQAAFQPFGAPFTLESTGLARASLDTRSADTRASQNDFGGSPIFLWVCKGLTIGAATEHLIAGLAASFPTDPQSGSPLNETANLRPGEVANLVVGRAGAFSLDYGAGSGPLPSYSTVAAVPEPTAALLMVMGCMAFACRGPARRRIAAGR